MTSKRDRIFTLLVVAGATVLSLYGLEALAVVANPRWLDQLGTTLRRGPSVIAETHRLRQRGVHAYPFLQSDLFTSSPDSGLRLPDGTTVAPLAGIPDALTVLCNESGTTLGYRADSLGFRNPPGAWNTPLVVLVGDSFTHGFCRPESETIAGHLRGLKIEVVNAGVTGAGPLTELGILREYIAATQPRVVYWLFYEGNDLVDLTSEVGTMTARYRDPGFTQQLRSTRDLPAALSSFGDSLLASYTPPGLGYRVRGFLTLRTLRVALGISGAPAQPGSRNEEQELQLLEETLALAKADVESWNGELRLVYLPERRRFKESAPVVGENHDVEAVRSAVTSIANNLLIPMIDGSELFAAQRDPAAMWDNRRYHYNGSGYRLIADAIAADLAPVISEARATAYTVTRDGR